MWFAHTREYYSALKSKEILTLAMPQMKLLDITLREISRHKKTMTVRFHLQEVPRAVRFVEAETEGGRNRGLFRQDEKFWKLVAQCGYSKYN